jgi:serine/threonine protein kinase
MSLTPGTRLGAYEIVALIGAGGMGEVYRAKDTRLDRTVAIKILPPQFAGDPELRARFEREGRAISSLDHPNICALYDVGEHDGTTFLVMQHLEGETLEARLKKAPLPFSVSTSTSPALPGRHYAVTKDGKRFLVNVIQETSRTTPLTVVVNWQASVQKYRP